MKKGLSLVLVMAMCLCLCACGKSQAVKDVEAAINMIGEVSLDSGNAIGSARSAYDALNGEEKAKVEGYAVLLEAEKQAKYLYGKESFENICIAWEKIEKIGADIYEAWRMAIYDKTNLTQGGIEYLASNMDVSEEDLVQGITYHLIYLAGKDWETISEEEKSEYFSLADDSFEIISNSDELSFFSYCLLCVRDAYILNGEMEQVQIALDNAKTNMKELNERYSDYEAYPNLKGFYSNTSSYFDFCQNPTGSFTQVKETINEYRNNARDYINDLGFIFE